MSLAEAFHALKRPELNAVASLDPEQKTAFRKAMISMVLATDLAKHFDYVGRFKVRSVHRLQRSVLCVRARALELVLTGARRAGQDGLGELGGRKRPAAGAGHVHQGRRHRSPGQAVVPAQAVVVPDYSRVFSPGRPRARVGPPSLPTLRSGVCAASQEPAGLYRLPRAAHV